MEKEEIIKQVLSKLDGWVLESEENDYDDLDYNKLISEDEILNFYDTASTYAKSYIQNQVIDNQDVFDVASCMWTAGLLWEKYNIRENNQEDNTNPFGYGDKLIIQAKEMLKPFKSYSFNAY